MNRSEIMFAKGFPAAYKVHAEIVFI